MPPAGTRLKPWARTLGPRVTGENGTTLSFAITIEEAGELDAARKKTGHKTFSGWARIVLLAEARRINGRVGY